MAGVGERFGDQAGVGGEVAEQGAGIGVWQRLFGHIDEQVGHESGGVAPAAVGRGLADLGARCDLGQIQVRETALGE